MMQQDQSSYQQPTKSKGGKGLLVLLIIAIVAIGGTWLWSSGAFARKLKIAIVTSGDSPYWDLVIDGAKKAAADRNVDLTVVKPKSDTEVQSQAIVALNGQKFDGVAISPINPSAETAILGSIAAESTLVTFDSDSAVSRRLCFVGTDNYSAGRLAGERVRQTLGKEGGDVIICLGSPDKENTQRRRQGVIDELLDRSFLPERPADPMDQPVKGSKFNIVATVVDNSKEEAAPQIIADAIKSNPSVKCVVGLLRYEAPAILKALDGNTNIKVIGFDCDSRTLDAIDSGAVAATMMQDQYGIGYQAVRILSDDLRGNRGGLPMFQTYPLSCQPVTKANLEAVRQQIKTGGPMIDSGLLPHAEAVAMDATTQPTGAPATQPAQ